MPTSQDSSTIHDALRPEATVEGSWSEPAPRDLSLDELSERSGVAKRTIRYYQSEGVLHRPVVRGGSARYDESHVERLASIADLQAKGLTLRTIRTLLGGGEDAGAGVVDLLGPEIAGTAWLRSSHRVFDEGELADLLGSAYPDDVPDLVSAGYLERRTDSSGRRGWYTYSVPQLRGAVELRRLGTHYALSGWSADVMRADLRELSELLVARWISEAGNLYEGDGSQAEFDNVLEVLRSVAWQSAAHVMAEEIGRALGNTDAIRERLARGDFSF